MWAFYDVKKVENAFEPCQRVLSDVDRQNLDDLIIISVEILMGFNSWDNSVLNPSNYMAYILLEYGLKKSPNNNDFKLWLMKLTTKLGLSSNYTTHGHGIKW